MPINPSIGSSLIGAGTGLLGGLMSGIGAKKAAKEFNQGQMELAKYQNQWNLEQWNRQNEYNSPKAQMARYQEAGLNPALMYSQGSSGNAGGTLTSATPSYQSPGGALAKGLSGSVERVGSIVKDVLAFKQQELQLKQQQQELENKRTQNWLLGIQGTEAQLRQQVMFGPGGYWRSMIPNVNSRTIGQNLRNSLLDYDAQFQERIFDYRVQKFIDEAAHARNQKELDKALLGLRRQQLKKLQADTRMSNYSADIQNWRLGYITDWDMDPYHANAVERWLGRGGNFITNKVAPWLKDTAAPWLRNQFVPWLKGRMRQGIRDIYSIFGY